MKTAFALAAFALLAPAGAAQAQIDPTATIETSMGSFTITLDAEHAPQTVANFIRYAREGHFDGTVIYRVVPGFVIQMGSYMADGSARPVHDPIPLEANNGLTNVRGSVAMARTDPDSTTAEFFVDLTDIPTLDHDTNDRGNNTGYAVFGHVTDGMDVVDKISHVPLGGSGPFGPAASPATPVTIEKVLVSGE